MHHATPLITTIVGGLVLAFILGMIANKLRISPLVGYLLAGVLAGPFTPGFVADTKLAPELAELGVILLMFGVGVIVIGVMLSIFQQFVGINVVLYYAPEVFKTLGASTDIALLQTIIVGVINLTFTVLAIMTVDKFGRKPLQIIGALGMAIGMFSLGTAFYTQAPGIVALLSMLFYVAAFAMSWGPVCWVLLSEIFPNAIRGKALAIAVAAQWLANYFVSWTFPMMDKNSWLVSHFHNGFSYWIYGCMGILAALFMWKFVPETKGKTLEELEELWEPAAEKTQPASAQ